MPVLPKTSDSTVTIRAYGVRLVTALLVINLFICAIIGLSLRNSFRMHQERAAVMSRNLAMSLQSHIDDAFDKADIALFAIAEEVAHQRNNKGIDRHALNTYLQRFHARLPFLVGLRIADAHGTVAYGSAIADKTADISDRDYFIRLRDNPNAGLVISKPVIGRISNKWILTCARRMNHPDGSFAGIVFAVFSIEHFTKMFSSLDTGKQGIVTLFGDDFSIYARYPELPGPGGSMNRDLKSSTIRSMIQAGRNSATFTNPSPLDGIERTLSYLKISDKPLYVVVGVATSDYVAEWRNEFVIMAELATLFLLLSLFAAWFIYNNRRRRISYMQALVSSETRYRTLFDNAGDGILILNTNGSILGANEIICTRLGYREEELLGKTPSAFVAAELAETVPERFRQIEKNGHAIFETVHVTSDGTRIPTEISARVIDYEGQHVVMSLARDISERKLAEATVQQSLTEMTALNALAQQISSGSTYTAIVETSLAEISKLFHPDLVLFFKRSGDDLELLRSEPANSPFKHHETPTHHVGECLCGLAAHSSKPAYSSDIRADIRCTWDECKKAGIRSFAALPLLVENNVIGVIGMASGMEVDFKKQASFLEVLSGEIALGLKNALLIEEVVQHADDLEKEVAERKRAEKELTLQGAALKAAANAIVITDRKGTIEWINPAFTALTGYSADETVGKNFRDLVNSGVQDQAFYKKMWDTLLAGDVWHGEITNRRKDGTQYLEEQTITPVRDIHGEITDFIGIKRDLTEMQKLEAQLRHAQKMESIGTLAGGVAHDFNNILTGIIGYGSLALMKMAPDDPQRINIQHVLEASERAVHLTKELLLFSRKHVLDRKPADLNRVVSKVEHFLKRVIGDDVTIRTMLHETELPVLADAYQLEQVLMNLATNARDSMPHGGTVTVTTGVVDLDEEFIRAHAYSKAGRFALITVSDTGSGMDEETQLHIFEPFFSTKEVGKGTGLGLAVVYGIIKQHDGQINVYSEPGHGTTFRVYLPLIEAELVTDAVPQQEHASRGTETILLAEDNELVRNLTKTVLTEFGYTVIEAVDGEDAVEKFSEHAGSIQLLLLDVIMPKMNGKDVNDAIHKIRPDIKTLFTSGYAPDVIRQKLANEVGIEMISKPVSPQDLLRKVRSVLDGTV